MAAPVVRALLFDVFGTLVDWRSSIAGALASFGKERGMTYDWEAFVDAWRDEYRPSMDRVRTSKRPWANLDTLHAESLDVLADRFGLPALGERDRDWIVKRWHALDPWPDTREGLERLRSRYLLGTLSNGNVALLVDLAKHANLRFDAIFSAELFKRYKPDPATYLGACELLQLEPRSVMLVAAHDDDLQAALACGLRAAFVARPTEYAPGRKAETAPGSGVDIAVADLHALADRLGA